MNILSGLWAAVKGLVGNIQMLSETVGDMNTGLRQRMLLDAQDAHQELLEDSGPTAKQSRKKIMANGVKTPVSME